MYRGYSMQKTKPLAWGAHVSRDFIRRVYEICDDLGWTEDHASWLMACMAFETGRTFSASKRNPMSSATGLIQFMDGTARGLGTTTKKLAQMSDEGQLEYVKRYFASNASRIHSLADMYMAILWPKGIAKSVEYALWRTGTRAYFVNRGLDANRDGVVTKGEAVAKVRALLAEGLKPGNVF